jgi:hypothetical protein
MKILFVENRYATWVFASVARELTLRGHEIHWLVQNPVFAPNFGTVHMIPFPNKRQNKIADRSYDWLARTDRGILHFGATKDHYPAYDRAIGQVIGDLRPDVTFGESTEFHELLAINHCKKIGRPYLVPYVMRYPTDRMAFVAFDTMDPVGGDGTQLTTEEVDAMLNGILQRQVVPSYMRATTPAPISHRIHRLVDKARLTWGWLRGERFITPSPIQKLRLNAARNAAYRRWEMLSKENWPRWESLLVDGKPWVLYAMQMQPESNLDVWGTPWNDQALLIREAALALQSIGAMLVVKPNPKSKYEMTLELIESIASLPNVIALPHTTPMANVFPHAPLVLSVTGTVLMECVFAGKPVASLGSHAMTTYPGVIHLQHPDSIAQALQDALKGKAPSATQEQIREMLQYLQATSYPATVWDPLAQPSFGTPKAVAALTMAFVDVLSASLPEQGNAF